MDGDATALGVSRCCARLRPSERGAVPDPQGEASGSRGTDYPAVSPTHDGELTIHPPETHGCIYIIDVPARRVEVLRDVKTVSDDAAAPVGWAKDLAFRPLPASRSRTVQTRASAGR